MNGFGRLPSWWIAEEHLRTLDSNAGRLGLHIATLKTYIGLVLMSGYKEPMVANASYHDLMRVTGLSREMVVRATYELDERLLVTADRSGYRNRYKLAVDERAPKSFAKLPKDTVGVALPKMSCRARATLWALKIYLVLLTFRRNEVTFTMIGHDKLREYTGLQGNEVRFGVDVLINHRLVHVDVDPVAASAGDAHPPHRYTMLGDLRLEREDGVNPIRKLSVPF